MIDGGCFLFDRVSGECPLLCLHIEEGSIYGHSPVVMVILSQGALRIGASDSLGECPYLMID